MAFFYTAVGRFLYAGAAAVILMITLLHAAAQHFCPNLQ